MSEQRKRLGEMAREFYQVERHTKKWWKQYANNLIPLLEKVDAQARAEQREEDAKRINDLEGIVDDLLGHWRAYSRPEWGDGMHAYYCLAKGAADTWSRAERIIVKAEGGEG